MADQSATGEIVFRTADTGIEGKTPVDLGDLDVVCIDALPSWVWYQEMPDFAEVVTGERAGRQLARAIQGREAFRRFNDELHEAHPGRCRRGTPSAMPAPGAVPSGGWRELAH